MTSSLRPVAAAVSVVLVVADSAGPLRGRPLRDQRVQALRVGDEKPDPLGQLFSGHGVLVERHPKTFFVKRQTLGRIV